MCMEKYVLTKKKYTNGLHMHLPLPAWVEKTVHGVETHWLAGKEIVPGLAVSK